MRSANRLAATVTHTIEQYAPGFEASIVSRTVMTPLDLERTYGMTGGHHFSRELRSTSVRDASAARWARYRTLTIACTSAARGRIGDWTGMDAPERTRRGNPQVA